MTESESLPPLPASEVRLAEQTCDRFEAAWKAGRRPRPEDYLHGFSEPARSAVLRQLLLLDWEYRRRAGDEPGTGDYLPRFAGDTAVIDGVGREMSGPVGHTPDWANPENAPETLSPDAGPGDYLADAGGRTDPAARYDLGTKLGAGGIGVVFRARDRLLGRDLAVKVLRSAHRDRPDARRRFVAEARVGSQLQHPAIVPVYELGRFGDGRPYITMKLVEGHTLAALLAARPRAADTTPLADLPRFLSVFEQVCQAMAYAHANGVVHRDLKPANVMVGAFGEVQVMDWGFAKQLHTTDPEPPTDTAAVADPPTDDADVGTATQSGTLMGTPAYMPPEQALGEAARVDARADVFALGAMLCEILTGRPPYSGESIDEVYQQAAAGDLADAHTRLDDCGADAALRDLAKRCLTADRDGRPTDAGGVARDVTTYLASAQERLRRAEVDRASAVARAASERRARRLTAALAAALLVGAGVAGWQAVIANRAKQEVVAAAAGETAAKEAAQAKEAETRAVLEFVQRRIIAAARPKGQEGGLGRDVTLRQALHAALAVVEKTFADQPLTEARVRMSLGESFRFLDEMKLAADQFLRAGAIFKQHLGAGHPDSVECMDLLATCYHVLSRHPEALKLRQEAVALNQATLGPSHPNTLASMLNLANSYFALHRHAEAFKLRADILPLAKVVFGPADPRTLTSMHNLADSYYADGKYADALKLREEAVPLVKAAYPPDHPDRLKFMSNLAGSYYTVNRYADAARVFAETLEKQRATLPADHRDTLFTMNNLAGTYQALNRNAEALPLFEKVFEWRKAKLPPGHPNTIQSMNNLATCYFALGRHPEALKLREETLDLCKEKLPPDHPVIFMTMANLAFSYHESGRHPEALKLREAVLARHKVEPGLDHPETLRSMGEVAASLVKLGRGAEALPIVDDVVRRAAGKIVYPHLIPDVMEVRLRHFEQVKDANGCRETAEQLEKLNRSDGLSLYDAARYRAVAAAVIRATDQSSDAHRRADAEADRAMAWLRQAVAAGARDLAVLTRDKDIDALRDRPDFEKLMADLHPHTGP